jgi:hypothetical protein
LPPSRTASFHVILDNLNTHKKNERWLKKHPKVHFRFTPTRSSWLNQIETWFSILRGQSLNGASFTDVEQLQEHIDAFIAVYNEIAEPFAWTKKRGLPAAVQKPPYHSALIPRTRIRGIIRLLVIAISAEDATTQAPQGLSAGEALLHTGVFCSGINQRRTI